MFIRTYIGLIDPDPERIPINITDPTIDSFWNGTWQRTSSRNTKIYDEIFKCIPTDAVTTFSALKKYQDEIPICKSDPDTAIHEISRIQVCIYLKLFFNF